MNGRLPERPTNIVDRSRPVNFQFGDRTIQALTGDTVATALFAAGVRVMAGSFKYHRPRGLMELGVHAAEPLMAVDGRYNTRIARVPVAEGMKVQSQLKTGLDIFKLADKAAGAMQVGFYYKNSSFYKSKTVWNKAREMMRSAPGNLGEIKPLNTRPHYDEVNLASELIVIGGGLAGLEAALLGAQAGIRVVLVEAEPWLGGYEAFQGVEGLTLIRELSERLTRCDNVTVLTGTTAAMLYPDGLFVCVQTCAPAEPFLERSFLIRPQAAVFATGAMDRPLMFENNDRPGVMFPQTVQRLIHLYALKPAERALVSGGDQAIYKTALDLLDSGVEVAGVADCRSAEVGACSWREMLKDKGVPVWTESTVREAQGKSRITGAVVAEIGRSQGRTVKVDAIVASSGRTPLFKLAAQSAGEVVYDKHLGIHLARNLPPGHAAAGRINGLEDQAAIRADGRLAAAQALAVIGLDLKQEQDAARTILRNAPASQPNPPQMRAVAGANRRRFICIGNDVTEKDIDQALEEGFNHLEMIKRYSTATMGPEQGSLSQANFLDYLAWKSPELMGSQQINTPRPPLIGVSMGVMAGAHHDIPKTTPLHEFQMSAGGRPVRTGPWLRIDHFGDPEGESLVVHEAAALIDVSTLGKFRLFGPDARKLYDRINTRPVTGLKDNRIKYTAACNEEGVVIDDGLIIRLAEDDFYFTTSTARAPSVVAWYQRWMEKDWRVWLVNLTEARAGLNLVGPLARDILSRLTSADISNKALPFMYWQAAEVAGVPCYLLRLGFLGELSYEIHCPSSQAGYLWEAILEAGRSSGLKQAGLATQFICRLEKGHVLPGLDADGNTTMFEAHFDWLWDRGNTDMVGGPMLRLLEGQPFKGRVIAFALEGRVGLIDGHLVVKGPERLGHITSVRYSPKLKQTIGLALVKPHEDFHPGGRVMLWLNGEEIEARFVDKPFHDPEGGRMRI
ncbi:MAG: 2Fe-2S iron-sulfur cluster-binding protein [Thermodesulfobacteriota bacterium]